MTVTVTRNEPARRFEATIDGELAGFIDYRARQGEITLIHTETLAGFEGQGVGSTLARSALDDIRARGERALVLCPFLRSWLDRHPGEYADIVALPD
jgi:predicted GNAT family acetyltransferase